MHAFSALHQAHQSGLPFQTLLLDPKGFEISAIQFISCIENDTELNATRIILVDGQATYTAAEQEYLSNRTRQLGIPIDKTQLFNALHHTGPNTSLPGVVTSLADRYKVSSIQQPLDILLTSSKQNDSDKVKRFLTQNGHKVYGVKSGAETLDAFDSHHFDLAIIDHELPDMSGLELVKIYRFSRLNQPWTPVIAILETPSASLMREYEYAGLSHYLFKPVDKPSLFNLIEQITSKQDPSSDYEFNTAHTAISTSSNESLLIDFNRLNELSGLGQGPDFLKSLLGHFELEFELILNEIKRAVGSGNCALFNEMGHRIRDCTGSIGALKLYQLGLRITRTSKDDFTVEAYLLTDEIVKAYHETKSSLQKQVKLLEQSAFNN